MTQAIRDGSKRQGWADAPMNGGQTVPMGAVTANLRVCGALRPGGNRDAKATHHPVFCESRLGRLPSGGNGSCLSFDVNGRGSSDPRLFGADPLPSAFGRSFVVRVGLL
jgi:hypothetical protein